MNTLIFIGSCCVLLLVVLTRIRGLDQFLKPLFPSMYRAVGLVAANLLAWLIYFFKTVAYSHIELARHLVLPATRIDPSVPMRDELRK